MSIVVVPGSTLYETKCVSERNIAKITSNSRKGFRSAMHDHNISKFRIPKPIPSFPHFHSARVSQLEERVVHLEEVVAHQNQTALSLDKLEFVAREREVELRQASTANAQLATARELAEAQHRIAVEAHVSCEGTKARLEEEILELNNHVSDRSSDNEALKRKLALSTLALQRSLELYRQLEAEQKMSLQAIQVDRLKCEDQMAKETMRSDRLHLTVDMVQGMANAKEANLLKSAADLERLQQHAQGLQAALDKETSKNIKLERLLTASRRVEAEARNALTATAGRALQLESKVKAQSETVSMLEQQLKDHVTYTAEIKRQRLLAQVEIEKLVFKGKFEEENRLLCFEQTLNEERRVLAEKHTNERQEWEKSSEERHKARQCRNCGVAFTLKSEEEQPSPCVFHPGLFEASGLHSLSRWTCCAQLGISANGCSSADSHSA
jgi:hypothetical protein